MTICSHTGLAKPECSCSACVRAQLERYYPSNPVAAAGSVRPSVIRRIAARARRPRQRHAV